MGRHKIPIKKIENNATKYICFSKRRTGLFRKGSDLAARGCSVGFVVFSPSDKVYSFGHPHIDSVAARFLRGAGQDPALGDAAGGDREERNDDVVVVVRAEEMEPEREAATAGMEMENGDEGSNGRSDAAVKGSLVGDEGVLKSDRFWWNRSIDGMGLPELQEFHGSLVELKKKVMDRADHLHASKSVR